ncbi:MAG: tryptophan 7-halogenase, partial [Candidatus Halalkalibacterium sp. M3_1C_030]
AIFSHFKDIKPWKGYLEEKNISTDDYPYDPDFSALHHLLKEGWMWMLRFNNELTSAGLLLNMNRSDIEPGKPAEDNWRRIIKRYPSLAEIFKEAKIADVPGQIIETDRLQRRLLKISGKNWAALPHTAGFIDPMHSTGIAHTLSGVEKLVRILTESEPHEATRYKRLKEYEQSVFTELELVDLLVAGSYKSMNRFRLFSTYTMLYFISAISYEQRRLRGEIPSHFLCADDKEIRGIINSAFTDLNDLLADKITPAQISDFEERVKSAIDPFNTAGLLNPESKNMYRHTAVDI